MIVECVPNFSEGRDALVVSGIARAIDETPHVRLLDRTSDPDHNRSVLTFAGTPEGVAHAAFEAVRVAAATIDIARHTGVHPRLGAADVVPFVPIDDVSLHDCATIAREVGHRIAWELGVPVYLYEAAALRPECARLENIRKLAPQGLPPDFGLRPHPTAGSCVVGARRFLIAWNVNLRSTDLEAAQAIARAIRESSGGLKAVKALGLRLASKGEVQVSINLVDFAATPLHEVFAAIAAECAHRGIEIEGSELIGMIPAAALEASRAHDLRWLNLRPELILENRLRERHD
jgi:glutamate formiminotransferase